MRIGLEIPQNIDVDFALQCYATQEYLKLHGIEVVAIDYAKDILPFKSKIKRRLFKGHSVNQNISSSLSLQSILSLRRFQNTLINREVCTKGYLEEKVKSGYLSSYIHGVTDLFKDAVSIPDPVVLLTAEEWKQRLPVKESDNEYILAYFTKNPSTKSIEMMDFYASNKAVPTINFGYIHPEFNNAKHCDGGPLELLSALKNATVVITDSFQVALLSLIFHKNFFINDCPTSGVEEFLSEIKQSDRYDSNIDNILDSFDVADRYLENVREKASSFIEDSFKNCLVTPTIKSVKDNKYECCGCGACVDACTHNAIALIKDDKGFLYPIIDNDKCVSCGLCLKVCSFKTIDDNSYIQKSYIVASKDKDLVLHSASGGAFAEIARDVINKGGIVFGASLWLDNKTINVEHVGIEAINELYKIQGSKYVQSNTQGVFPVIKEYLQNGRRVLFGGTSCQVAALKGYLKNDYENLLTTDLICHGVPNLQILQNYIDSLGLKDRLIDFKFRKRMNFPYTLTLTLTDKYYNTYRKEICWRDSAYYTLFISCADYRPSCYGCPFADIHKPGDITLGDYYINESKESQGYPQELVDVELLSTVIVNTDRGNSAFQEIKDKFVAYPVSFEYMRTHHQQLTHPSLPTQYGESLYALFKEKGFGAVQNAINISNFVSKVRSELRKEKTKKS